MNPDEENQNRINNMLVNLWLALMDNPDAVVRKLKHYGRDLWRVKFDGYWFDMEPDALDPHTCVFTLDTRYLGDAVSQITDVSGRIWTEQEKASKEARKNAEQERTRQLRNAAIVSAVETLMKKSQSILGAGYVLEKPYTADSLMKICSDILKCKEKVTSSHNEICLYVSDKIEIKDKRNKKRLFTICYLKKERRFNLYVFDAKVQDYRNPNCNNIGVDFYSTTPEFNGLSTLHDQATKFNCERLGVEWLTARGYDLYCEREKEECPLRATCSMYTKARDYMSQLTQSKANIERC